MKRNNHWFLHAVFLLAACLLGGVLCSGQMVGGTEVDLGVFPADPERRLNSVAFGNGIFVAVGDNRIILVSNDGTNWVEGSDVPEIDTIGVNYSIEYYTAGNESLTLVIPNEETVLNELPSKPFQFRAVEFGNGKFVIVGDSGEIHYSSDGRNWLRASTPVAVTLNGIVYGDRNFVAVGDDGVVLTSPDALKWSLQRSGTTNTLYAVAYGNQRFMAVGGSMDESEILSSTDGVNWLPIEENHGCPLVGVAFGNNQFVVVAGYGYGFTAVSADGKNWRPVENPSSFNAAIAFEGNRFIAMSFMGQPTSSRDGSNWEPSWMERNHPSSFIQGKPHGYAAYGNGIYVAVESGYLAASKDAIHWSSTEWPRSTLLHGRIIQNHLYGPFYDTPLNNYRGPPIKSEPLRSHDGQSWRTFAGMPVPGNVGGSQTRMLRGAIPAEYAVLYSKDGIRWTRLQPINSSQTKLVAQTIKTNSGPSSANQESNIAIDFELNGHSYQLNLPAKVGQIYQLQASTDLEHWENLTILTNTGAAFVFSDEDVAKFPQRFYRLKPQP